MESPTMPELQGTAHRCLCFKITKPAWLGFKVESDTVPLEVDIGCYSLVLDYFLLNSETRKGLCQEGLAVRTELRPQRCINRNR